MYKRQVLQTVYEKGVTDADFAELREETFVEVSGVLRKEERAPRGMELRLKSVRILSKPEEPMPIAVSKWKMSASLEAKLDMRSLTLRNLRAVSYTHLFVSQTAMPHDS